MSEAEMADTLSADGDFQTPLSRVNYAAGMLLGVDATRAEQAYHRQRLNRHRYWVHGPGTVVGLGVYMHFDPADVVDSESDVNISLIVTPGTGIDGLGREVLCYEPYCINLGDWFAAQLADPQGSALLQNGLEDSGQDLSLLVTMRYQDCDSGLQPTLARKVNAGTDPVSASRRKDSLLLEITPALLPENPLENWPWRGHSPLSEELAPGLTGAEQVYVDALEGRAQQLAQLQGQLIYSLPASNNALAVEKELDDVARTLLAYVKVPLRPGELPAISPVINPNVIQVNNLLRPFVVTTDQLAWLSQQPEPEEE